MPLLSPRMPGPWIDAHCHLADTRLESQLADVMSRSLQAGVSAWVQGGVDPQDWQRQLQLRERFGDGIALAFGLHPWWVANATDSEIDGSIIALEQELSQAAALGELGLDKHPRRLEKPGALQRQLRAFDAQLDMVERLPKPLVLHVVRGHEEVLARLAKRGRFAHGGLVHAFSGSADQARRYIDLGFHLSLGGAYIANPRRTEAISAIPVDFIVVETDSPDQAPRAWGTRFNEPANLPRIADALAPAWGLAGPELLRRSKETLHNLFWSKP